MRELDEIVQDMQRIAGPLDQVSPPDDLAHQDADALLIEALRVLAVRLLPPSTPARVEELIAAYEHIGKWYA